MKTETPQMDWRQVVLNGGPPCFHVEGPQYCGRAEHWQGHGNKAFHEYVSLDDLLNAERERCAKIAEVKCTEWGELSELYWREGDHENARIRHGWSCGAAAIVKEIRGRD